MAQNRLTAVGRVAAIMSQIFWNSTANCFVPLAVLRRIPSAMPIAAETPIAGAPSNHHRANRAGHFLSASAADVDLLNGQLALIDHDDHIALPVDSWEHSARTHGSLVSTSF